MKIKIDPNKFVTCSGSKFKTEYSPKVDKDGTVTLVECGKVNFHEYIQSFREQTDIDYMIKKIAMGDMSVLRSNGMYGDFTKYPSTLSEVLQLQIDSNRLFDSLPADVKKSFDNDRNKFFALSGSEEWYSKIAPVLPDEVKSAIFPQKPVEVKPVVGDDKE